MEPENILIADESPIDARVTSRALAGVGYNVTIAQDSREMLNTARALHPDLLMLNVANQDVDGYQICRELKADPGTHDIGVMLYTSRDRFIDVVRGIEAGADDFVTRIQDYEDLVARVQRILIERQTGQDSPLGSFNLSALQALEKFPDRLELINFLYNEFNANFWTALRDTLGGDMPYVLVKRAIGDTAAQFPHVLNLQQSTEDGVSFAAAELNGVPARDLIEGFQAFNSEMYDLALKVIRVQFHDTNESRHVTEALLKMASELRAKAEELQQIKEQQAEPPPLAVAAEETVAAEEPAVEPLPETTAAEPPLVEAIGDESDQRAEESLAVGMASILTRPGDAGETTLADGTRVSKASTRIAACGDVDEVNTLIGLVRCELSDPEIDQVLRSIQNDLLTIEAGLANPAGAEAPWVVEEMVTTLEHLVDRFNQELPPLEARLLPSGEPSAVLLHMVRVAVRRAERRIVRLNEEETVHGHLLAYANRLSDLLLVLARVVNHRLGIPEERGTLEEEVALS